MNDTTTQKQQTNEELIKLVERWRKSPLAFVIECLGATPTQQQVAVLEKVAERGAKIAVKSCTGAGKSTVFSWLILHNICCFSDVKVIVTAPTAHQLEDVIWSEVKKWLANMLEPWKSSIQLRNDKIWLTNSPGFAVARTGRKENPEALQGFHSNRLVFLMDEASGIDEKVFEVAQGTLTGADSTIVMISNPTRLTGYFYEAFNKNRDFWTRFTFSAFDSPNVEPQFIEQIEAEYGKDSDMYKVRVLGEFPSASDLQFIPSDLVDKAFGKQLQQDEFNFAPKILGVDVAMFGGDRSVITLRQGLYSNIVFQKRGIKPEDLAAAVARLEDEHQVDGVIVDATGVGEAVLTALRLMNRHAFAFYAGSAAKDKACFNARMEVWMKMRNWLKDGGSIPDNSDLRDDLIGPEFGYNSHNKLQLEKKEEMKKRGLSSPDLADSLALTFAFPIHKREVQSSIGGSNIRNNTISDSDYDPLKF